MKLPDFIHTTTFRWTSITFAACILLFSAFIYWEAAAYMLAQMDAAIAEESLVIAGDTPDRQVNAIEDRLNEDPHRVRLAGLFDADGHRIAGNVESLPPSLAPDGGADTVSLMRIDALGRETQRARGVMHRLPDGDTLIIARNVDESTVLGDIVERVLALGLIPALGLALVAGTFLSIRAQRRVEEVTGKVQRIVAGDVPETIKGKQLKCDVLMIQEGKAPIENTVTATLVS